MSYVNKQWCSPERNIRDRDFIKNSNTRGLKFETRQRLETLKFVDFADLLF